MTDAAETSPLSAAVRSCVGQSWQEELRGTEIKTPVKIFPQILFFVPQQIWIQREKYFQNQSSKLLYDVIEGDPVRTQDRFSDYYGNTV